MKLAYEPKRYRKRRETTKPVVESINIVPYFSDLWVPSASSGGAKDSSTSGATSGGSTATNVTFSSTANLTEKAKSDRADQYKVAP